VCDDLGKATQDNHKKYLAYNGNGKILYHQYTFGRLITIIIEILIIV